MIGRVAGIVEFTWRTSTDGSRYDGLLFILRPQSIDKTVLPAIRDKEFARPIRIVFSTPTRRNAQVKVCPETTVRATWLRPLVYYTAQDVGKSLGFKELKRTMLSEGAYRQFWTLVWPHLEAGAWRYDMQPSPRAEEASADHLDGRTTAVSAGLDADLNGCDGGIVTTRGGDSNSGSRVAITEKDDRGVCGGGDSQSSSNSSSQERRDSIPLPVFFPPAVGVASKDLERVLHQEKTTNVKASTGNRIERLEGIGAVVDLLQRVPGYLVMTSSGSVPSMDAIAAVARAVLVPTAGKREVSYRSMLTLQLRDSLVMYDYRR